MPGRILALVIGAAMVALALYLRDPSIYGAGTPGVSLGGYEAFRPMMIFCVAGLALCGLMAAFGPGERSKTPALQDTTDAGAADAASHEANAESEPEPDTFRISSAPTASPLW